MKSSKNYLLKIMLILVLIISCMLIMVACDKKMDTKSPYKYEKSFGIELTVATVSGRNVGFNLENFAIDSNYSALMQSNLLTEEGKAKLKEVQKKTHSNAYGVYLGYDKDDNEVLYIGGVLNGALYEKYDCALPYSPRDIITKMEEAVGHELTEDWLNASETGIDIIFLPSRDYLDSDHVPHSECEVAYMAQIDGQVYVITM